MANGKLTIELEDVDGDGKPDNAVITLRLGTAVIIGIVSLFTSGYALL